MSIILGVVGFYGLTNLNKSNEQLHFMVEERMIPISELGNVETLYQEIRVHSRFGISGRNIFKKERV